MLFIKVGFLLYVLKGYEVLYYEYKCSGYKCQLNMYLEIEFQIIEMYFNIYDKKLVFMDDIDKIGFFIEYVLQKIVFYFIYINRI